MKKIKLFGTRVPNLEKYYGIYGWHTRTYGLNILNSTFFPWKMATLIFSKKIHVDKLQTLFLCGKVTKAWHKKNLAEIFKIKKIKCWDLSMKEGNLFVLFVCHVEISQTMAPLAMFLVLLLESSQRVRVHWVSFIMLIMFWLIAISYSILNKILTKTSFRLK